MAEEKRASQMVTRTKARTIAALAMEWAPTGNGICTNNYGVVQKRKPLQIFHKLLWTCPQGWIFFPSGCQRGA